MELYVLQCLSGREEAVREALSRQEPSSAIPVYIPRRRMRVRRRGVIKHEEYQLFPGYVFIEAENISPAIISSLRHISGALHFLPSNADVRPMDLADRDFLARLLFHGEIIGDSRVEFDTNNRIVVISGPMEGLEGKIIKVNRRKGRAKVRLDFYDRNFEVDFSFVDIKKSTSADKQGKSEKEA